MLHDMLFVGLVIMFGYKMNNQCFFWMEGSSTILTYMIPEVQMHFSDMFVKLTFCVRRKIALLAHDIPNLIMTVFM